MPLAIMLDTKGPEIRLGEVKNGQFAVSQGHKLLLVKEAIIGDEKRVQVTPSIVVDTLDVGMRVLIDDGYLITHVVEKTKEGILLEIENPGLIKSHKGVNIPGVNIALPAMTKQDIEDIVFGCKEDIDIIAASFIRSADHVLEIKSLLAKEKKSEILVIAKIENSLGVQNFDSIIQIADGVMVARGDLGVELPLNQVPRLQKMMIRKCYQAANA
jgi:pyruvate kinase